MDQQGVDIDPLVGQHAVDLLDRILGHKPTGQRQTLADQGHRERGGLDRPEGGPRQRENAIGMQVLGEQASQQAVNALKRDLPVGWHRTVPCIGSRDLESRLHTSCNAFLALNVIQTSSAPVRVFS